MQSLGMGFLSQTPFSFVNQIYMHLYNLITTLPIVQISAG